MRHGQKRSQHASRAVAYVLAVLLLLPSTLARPQPAGTVTIDVLVLYTEKAERLLRERYQRTMDAEVLLVEALQNRVFENSKINVIVRLSVDKIVFDEDQGSPTGANPCGGETDRKRIVHCLAQHTAPGNDKFGIHALRKKHKSDLVSVWMWSGGWYEEGSAAQSKLDKHLYKDGQGAEQASQKAYLTLVLIEKAWQWWHFAHELGHMFGLADPDDFDELINNDAYGYTDLEYPFRTIMAYNNECKTLTEFLNCPRIPVYSTIDPSVTFFGHKVGQSGFSDAAKTIRQTAPFVATYDQFLK